MAWKVFLSHEFHRIFNKLIDDVDALSSKDPAGYKSHPKSKLLLKLQKVISAVIDDPDAPEFRLGKTLGSKFSEWRRVKRDLPSRYRLFFKFFSDSKEIFFVWMNNESCLRKEGDRRDVYEVFKAKLKRGEIPADRQSLVNESQEHEIRPPPRLPHKL